MAKKKKSNAPDTEQSTTAPLAQEADMTPERGGMPYSTAILAIILAFVLGAVVGSVVPQFTQPKGSAAPAPVAAIQQTPAQQAPAQAGQQVPHEQLHVIQNIEKQLAKDPANRELYVALGNACFDAHLHERAIQAYEKALAMNAKDADVLTDVGIMYRETGAFDTALERFRQAQGVDPAHINAAFNEGVVLYYDLHRKPEALARWQRLLEANPSARAPNGKNLADLIKELQ